MITAWATLYSVASTKKIKEWTISVEERLNGHAAIIRRSGYCGQKITMSEKLISKGKSIGRANETTPLEQALSMAQSMYQKQIDKQYTKNFPDLTTWTPPEFPMLAHGFTNRKHNIKYPCFVQPKFDGVRCFAKKINEDEVTYTSRSGKKYTTLDHLTPLFLASLAVGDIVDGEVYIHDETFQEIIRRVKKLRPESITLQFMAYDIIPANDRQMVYSDRHDLLNDLFEDVYPEISTTQTDVAHCEDDIYTFHDHFFKAGYEGVIIRNGDGVYVFGNRSKDLQKYKEFIDDEFLIVGAVQTEDGNHRGCVKFVCETKDGIQFTSYPKGTLEERRQMYIDREKYIGKQLTIRYQQLSEDGVPVFNVGIAVRDYE